ncbi:CorA metal ion transporter [Haplosporangium sp. Z 767]|nr:CorA metal ion transporter [Haplosporangium sp. Z 767]
MDHNPNENIGSTSTKPATNSHPTRQAPRRAPSELSALSRSILSLQDDFDHSHDTQEHDSGSDRSRRDRHRNRGHRERRQDYHGSSPSEDTARLLADSIRDSSCSFSSQSPEGGHYSENFDGSSSILFGESFVDHQPLQRHVHDQQLYQQRQKEQHSSDLTSSQQTVRQTSPRQERVRNGAGSLNNSTESRTLKSLHLHPSSPPGRPVSSTRSHSISSQASHQHPRKSNQPPRHSAGSSPHLSERSSGSDAHRDQTEDTLIMPQISTSGQGQMEQDRERPFNTVQSSHSIAADTIGPTPRLMTPSPVPLHARLSKIQREARRGARVLDMDNHGNSHHYDYEEMTDSSYDFSSRRHSVAEEDVCYPLQSSNLDIDYAALEEYIRQEQIKNQKLASNSETANTSRPRELREKTKSSSSGLLSRLKGSALASSFSTSTPLSSKAAQDANYGTIPGAGFVSPERSYSLFGERDRNQTLLEDAYRFTLYSTASVTVHAQSLGEIPPRGQTLSHVLQAGYFWLDVLAPTDEEIRMLSQVFRIHPLTTEDILMEEGREKCEMFLNYYFVCFRTFVLDPNSHNYLQALSVYTLVFPGGIISYHFRPVPHCRNVRKRIRHLKERMEVTPDWINYAIIDDIVDTFAPLIRQVETEVDMIDELVLILKESEQTDMLRRIGNCRKRVMSLLRLLTGKADVIKGLIKRYEGRMGRKNIGEIGLFMGDIQDHIITMLQNLSHYEKILSRSHSNYLAQINIEMTSASNETNNVLTKLTVMGSIVLPMNLVTGLWGMNVPVPGQETEDLKATKKVSHKFTIDCSGPAGDKIFDAAAFEKFLHDRIKIEGRTGGLADKVTIVRADDAKITVTANQDFSKRYLKYLTKKFLKKHQLRDWLRVIASDKGTYELRYFNIANQDDDEDEE